MAGNNGLRSQIENLKYDRDLLLQELKTFLGMLKRRSINSRIKEIESKISQLQAQLSMWNQVPTSPDRSLVELHQKLTTYFDNTEIRFLCFEMAIDYDEVIGESKTETIRRLILHIDRRQRIAEFIAICKQSRPTVEW